VARLKEEITAGMGEVLPRRALQSVVATLPAWADTDVGTLDVVHVHVLLKSIERSVKLFGGSTTPQLIQKLRACCTGGAAVPAARKRIPVRSDADVLVAQSTCQQLCSAFFNSTDVVRLATVVSELARNIYMYAREGEILLEVAEAADGVRFSVEARDQGPGIANLEHVLSGAYNSRTGLGRGLKGSKALLDGMDVDTGPGRGTTVRGWKRARTR